MIRRNPVTISQVAQAAQVSTQTVSRVINNHPDVAEETRRRVQNIIETLGFQPNALARSLIRRRSQTLGVVALAEDYFGPSRVLVGIEKAVRAQGYSLLLDLLHHSENENPGRILQRLTSRRVDGILWAIPEIGANRAWLESSDLNLPVPTIFLSMQPRPGRVSLAVDNRAGARQAVRHLIEQGYPQIGVIAGPPDWWEAAQRRLGWEDALLEAGLLPHAGLVAAGDWSAASGTAALARLLEANPGLPAVFAANDQMALGALHEAHRRGSRVPASLAVVGFDNLPEAAYFWPPLTSVYQPLAEMGAQAVQALIAWIETGDTDSNHTVPQTAWLPTELIVRASSLRTLNKLH
jgi:LacI family transcriptional regulator